MIESCLQYAPMQDPCNSTCLTFLVGCIWSRRFTLHRHGTGAQRKCFGAPKVKHDHIESVHISTYLENKLLQISINFNPKTSHSCLAFKISPSSSFLKGYFGGILLLNDILGVRQRGILSSPRAPGTLQPLQPWCRG